jgi:ATP-dependent Clp endopeptidase proteolytic subunit ClpP
MKKLFCILCLVVILCVPALAAKESGVVNAMGNTVWFDGAVTQDSMVLLRNTLTVMSVAQKDSGSKEPIWLYINSFGGELDSVLMAYDYIQLLKMQGVTINTVAVGGVYSAGVILLQAGTERYATGNCGIMVHQCSALNVITGEKDARESAENFRWFNLRFIRILAGRTGQSIGKIERDIYGEELWFTAWEAKKYGLVDYVLDFSYVNGIRRF